MDDFAYDIVCSKERFNLLKNDERFLGLLTLSKAINALRFCQQAAIDAKDMAGPAGARSRINSFLYASSVLYEGFLIVEKLGKHFKNIDSFRNGFGALLKDKTVRSLRESVLKRMRNKFVFHFDPDVARESFTNFELSEYTFASGIGKASGEMYFGLADEAVINFLLQPTQNEPDESLKGRWEKILEETSQIMGRFTESTERLMADALVEMGFTVKRRRKTQR